jgi:hypothetical protein
MRRILDGVSSERRGGLRVADPNLSVTLLRFFPVTSMPSRNTAITIPRLPRLAVAMTDD